MKSDVVLKGVEVQRHGTGLTIDATYFLPYRMEYLEWLEADGFPLPWEVKGSHSKPVPCTIIIRPDKHRPKG